MHNLLHALKDFPKCILFSSHPERIECLDNVFWDVPKSFRRFDQTHMKTTQNMEKNHFVKKGSPK